MGKSRAPSPMTAAGGQTKTLRVTREQIKGIIARQLAVTSAQTNLNNFLSGIVAGHGYDRVQVIACDDEKLTIAVLVLPVSPAPGNQLAKD